MATLAAASGGGAAAVGAMASTAATGRVMEGAFTAMTRRRVAMAASSYRTMCHGPYRHSSSAAFVRDDDSSRASSSSGPSTAAAGEKGGLAFPQRRMGQPLPHSHPHLFPKRHGLLQGAEPLRADAHTGMSPVAEDELTPGLSAAEYDERRRRLMARLPEGSAVLCASGKIKRMSGQIFYRFRQESNFYYLTGFQEPDCALLLVKDAHAKRGYTMTMFLQPHGAEDEKWNGPRTGLDGVRTIFGADDAFEWSNFSNTQSEEALGFIKANLQRGSHIFVDMPQGRGKEDKQSSKSLLHFLTMAPSKAKSTRTRLHEDASAFDAVADLIHGKSKSRPLGKELDQVRLYKTEAELKLMRRSGRIASHAMMETMASARPGCTEWQLQSTFEASCALAGAQRPAYVPVVASGRNALTIHYVQNDSLCAPSDLVCMDAGCELDGYVSDITRAFPVNGRFSGPQRDLYGAVLSVLKACTKLATEAQGYTLSGLHRRSVEMLAAELRRLGFDLPAGSLERDVYPHALSHWLGIDLHDTPTVDRNTELRSGMCLSVEPAVYCREGTRGVPPAFWGLGIRIEDDVALWGKDDNVVLNAECVREIADVEAVCSGFWKPVSTTTAELAQSQTQHQEQR